MISNLKKTWHIVKSGIINQKGSMGISTIIICFLMMILITLPLVMGGIELERFQHEKQRIQLATEYVTYDIVTQMRTGDFSEKRIVPDSQWAHFATREINRLLNASYDIKDMTMSFNQTQINIQYKLLYKPSSLLKEKWLDIDLTYDVGIDN